ncbi:MAG: PEP/pyruvate-binding domain-containing protein, partial [Myxococcota bacterium]
MPEALVIAAAARSASAEDRERLFEWLATAAEKLGGPLAVRSSAALEDGIVSAAPGVFASILDVAPDRVASAVRAVWASADTPLVRDYAGARGIDEVAIAVIVQRQVGRDGSAVHGVMYTRQPGRPDSDTMLLEVYRGVQTAGHGEAGASTPQAAIPLPRRGSIPPQDVLDVQIIEQLRDYALGAEEAIGARSGADVEWVLERCDPAADSAEHARLWLVQARPIVHPPERAGPRFPLALLQFSRGEPERVWRLDAAHNPDPLSPAQTGIVEYLDRAGVAPYAMRVVGGYLYTAETAATGSAPAGDLSGDELWQRFDSELRPAMDSAVGRAAPQAESVQVALAAYRDFYRIYTAELTPLISRAKAVLPAFLDSVLDREDERDSRRLTGELVPQALWSSLYDRMIRTVTGESSLADLAEYVAPLAPAWDVASATFAETPDVLHRAVAGLRAQRAGRRAASAGPAASDAVSHAISLAQSLRAEIAKRRGADAAERFDHCRELAVVAYRIGDLDDHLYAS